MYENKMASIGHCEGCDHISHEDDLNQCPDCENHFHEDCAGWEETGKDRFVCESCAEDYPYYCKHCEVILKKDEVLTPVIFGFFGNAWIHKKCMKAVTKADSNK